MAKVVTAEYDASENALRLKEPLEGVKDHAEVQVTVEAKPPADPGRPWLALSGSMPAEDADDLQRAMNELFPPWND